MEKSERELSKDVSIVKINIINIIVVRFIYDMHPQFYLLSYAILEGNSAHELRLSDLDFKKNRRSPFFTGRFTARHANKNTR